MPESQSNRIGLSGNNHIIKLQTQLLSKRDSKIKKYEEENGIVLFYDVMEKVLK